MRRAFIGLACVTLVFVGQPAQATTQNVSITDTKFVPTHELITPGIGVSWTNNGAVDHRPGTNAGLPGEFDTLLHSTESSGATFFFERVGRWPYHDLLHKKLTGTVDTIIQTSTTEPLGAPFTLTWASSSGPPLAYDIQVRLPHSKKFVTLFRDTSDLSGSFLPSRRGTYAIRGRTKNVTNGEITLYSPAIKVTVT